MQILSSHSTRPKIGTLASQPIHPMSQCLPLIIGIGAIQHMLIIHGFSLFIFEWLRLGSKLCPICHKVGLQQTSETHFSCETKFSLGHLKWAWQSNFCDIFHFTLSLIFTRTVTIWPFLGVFCLDPHKNAVWSKQVHIFCRQNYPLKSWTFEFAKLGIVVLIPNVLVLSLAWVHAIQHMLIIHELLNLNPFDIQF